MCVQNLFFCVYVQMFIFLCLNVKRVCVCVCVCVCVSSMGFPECVFEYVYLCDFVGL